jgi:hypothetical protein
MWVVITFYRVEDFRPRCLGMGGKPKGFIKPMALGWAEEWVGGRMGRGMGG